MKPLPKRKSPRDVEPITLPPIQVRATSYFHCPHNAMNRLSFPDLDRSQPPSGLRCDCGAFLPFPGPGADYTCDRCGRDYNSSGQALAPRSQWGEETGETAADYYAGFHNPGAAFNGD